jgi:hypothetical protein
MGWSDSIDAARMQLSALIDASSDRYPSASDANGDAVFAKVRAQYASGADDQELEPFIEYSPKFAFAPTFKSRQSSSQDVAIGFDKAFNYDVKGNRIRRPKEDSTRETVWSFAFTGTVKRRMSSAAPDSWIAAASPSLTWNVTNTGADDMDPRRAQWNISVELDTSWQKSDSMQGASQWATLVAPVITAGFTPPMSWFPGQTEQDRDKRRDSIGRPRIDFQLQFVNVSTNATGQGFHQWTVGPSIKASWRF